MNNLFSQISELINLVISLLDKIFLEKKIVNNKKINKYKRIISTLTLFEDSKIPENEKL